MPYEFTLGNEPTVYTTKDVSELANHYVPTDDQWNTIVATYQELLLVGEISSPASLISQIEAFVGSNRNRRTIKRHIQSMLGVNFEIRQHAPNARTKSILYLFAIAKITNPIQREPLVPFEALHDPCGFARLMSGQMVHRHHSDHPPKPGTYYLRGNTLSEPSESSSHEFAVGRVAMRIEILHELFLDRFPKVRGEIDVSLFELFRQGEYRECQRKCHSIFTGIVDTSVVPAKIRFEAFGLTQIHELAFERAPALYQNLTRIHGKLCLKTFEHDLPVDVLRFHVSGGLAGAEFGDDEDLTRRNLGF